VAAKSLPVWLLVLGCGALAGCLKQPYGATSHAIARSRAHLEAAAAGQRPSREHLYVLGRHLYDRCGEQVVLRGVSKMVIWTDREGETFEEIARTGANTVRIVWTIKDHPGAGALDRVLGRALDAHLIPMIELHDATGHLGLLPRLVDFWTSPEIVEVLRRHQASLLLNVANEAGGSGVGLEQFVGFYQTAIARMRQAGIRIPLVIDAPHWGQDIDLLQAAAPRLLQADPERNLLFSVHMWWPQDEKTPDPGSRRRIAAELAESAESGLPLVVGEFAHAGVGCARYIDYQTILAECQRQGIGWLAWEWGPGNRDCDEMDMTENGKFETLHGWGLDITLQNPKGIRKTSRVPESLYRERCPRVLPVGVSPAAERQPQRSTLPGSGAPP
jgi:mannan endo-1,4-beta-mannosidase